VHAHLYFPTLAAALMRLMQMSPSRTCATFHNLAYSGANPKTLKLEARRWLSTWLCAKGIGRFVAVSRSVADHYEGALGLSSVTVVPNAVNLTALLEFDLSRSGSVAVGSDCKVVLPGRIVREKGHSDLVEALALLKARGFVPTVTFAGDGPLRPDVEDEVRSLGLESSVKFVGALPHNEMLRLIGAADVIVVPSRFEGFGIAALEGMALGRAVVATTAGGLPETLGDAGVLVGVQDPPGLASAIEQLLVDPERRARLGELARARSQEFDLPIVTAKLISVYSEMLSADPNHART
jgi:glycogen(starch) synthase